MSDLIRDVRYGLRALARNPGFAMVAVATLALGIGATTSVFTVVDAVLLRPLPYPEPDRLFRLFVTDTQSGDDRDNVSAANFLDWKVQATSFEAIAGFVGRDATVVDGDHPARVRGVSVTPEFFSVLGAQATLGRVFSPEVDRPEGEPAVVVSDGFWRSTLGAAGDVLGSRLTLSNEPYTVVGVMPPGFAYPPGTVLWTAARYRVPDPPVDLGPDPTQDRGGQYISTIGRLRQGVLQRAAQSEMSTIGERLAREYPGVNKDEGVAMVGLQDSMVSEARPLLLLLLAAVGFVLLLACSNVAHLLLARATQREREIAVRLALGAGPGRVVRQLLAESLLLAACGGVIGAALASWGAQGLPALAPEEIPRAAEVSVDLRVLAFTTLIALGTGLLFGLAPAPQVFGQRLQLSMRQAGGYSVTGRGGRLRSGLVVAEVAISLLLLVGTGLMIRTFLAVAAVDAGFDPARVLAAHLTLPSARYAEDDRLRSFHRQLLERLRALPGVESASTVLTLPMQWNIRGNLAFQIDGRPTADGEGPAAGFQLVSEDYFRTLGIPLVRGRFFAETDDERAPAVALVNEALARAQWSGADPIGRRIRWDDGDWVTIVGVVGNTRVEGLDQDPRPETYRPFLQSPMRYMTVVLRGSGEAAALAPVMAKVVTEIDPQQPLHGVATMEHVLSASLAPRRFNMLLLGVFGGVALVMAAIGLYGVLCFSVTQRTREIGVRRALGAETRDVIRQVLREASRLVLAGLALGALASLALTRLMSSLIHGIPPTDPPSYALGLLLLLMVALGASGLPALRASRVDPVVALRYE